MKSIVKFLRYPGSKRRMLQFLIKHLPEKHEITGRFIEPFLGSGAVFFSVAPHKAILSDINPDLIDLFQGIKIYPSTVWSIYSQYGNSKEDYLRIRGKRQQLSPEERAARVLYLNRTCFKGMWRTNKKGEFNVGYGGEERRWVINEQNLIEVSQALKHARINCEDFESAVLATKTGDFIFLDPPYRPHEKEEINYHYLGRTFSFEEQKRLSRVLAQTTSRNIRWAMTNSSHPDIVGLFSGCYLINFPKGTGTMPGILVNNSGEVLITNYPISGGIQIQ